MSLASFFRYMILSSFIFTSCIVLSCRHILLFPHILPNNIFQLLCLWKKISQFGTWDDCILVSNLLYMIPGFIHFSACYLWNSVFLRAHLNAIVHLFSLAVHLQPSLFTYLDFRLTPFIQEDKVIKDSEMWAFSHKKNWVFKCQNNDLEMHAWIMWKFQVSFRRDLLMAPLIRIICWWQWSWLLHGVSSMTWS